jgi:ubiquinone/menaquinone biosynthesis C-methylase UbiE
MAGEVPDVEHDDVCQDVVDTQVHADDLALIARYLSIRRGAVLDVGCGPGHLTAHLRSLEADATGLDLVPEFLDHARVTHPDGRYELGSMHQLPVPDRSVASILAWYSVIHLPPDDLDGVLPTCGGRWPRPACWSSGSSTATRSWPSSTGS